MKHIKKEVFLQMWKDSETEIDFLDFSYIVEIMKDTINDEKLLPSCIGLYGDWGSGKSSLMHMCKRQLEQQNDGTVCLLFNGWLYESYNDAKTAILASVLDGIKGSCRWSWCHYQSNNKRSYKEG